MSTQPATARTVTDKRDMTAGNPLVLEAQDLHRHYRVNRGLFKGHTELRAVNGASFTLAAGSYAADAVQVRLADVGGSPGEASSLATATTIDTTGPTAPTLASASGSTCQCGAGASRMSTR